MSKKEFQEGIKKAKEIIKEGKKEHDEHVKTLVVFVERSFDYLWVALYCSFSLGFTLALILVLFNIL